MATMRQVIVNPESGDIKVEFDDGHTAGTTADDDPSSVDWENFWGRGQLSNALFKLLKAEAAEVDYGSTEP